MGSKLPQFFNWKKVMDPSNVPPSEMHGLKHKAKTAFHTGQEFLLSWLKPAEKYLEQGAEANEDLILPKLTLDTATHI